MQDIPPSTTSFAPLINLALSLARYKTASEMSVVSPNTNCGSIPDIILDLPNSLSNSGLLVIPVLMAPGHTILLLIP